MKVRYEKSYPGITADTIRRNGKVRTRHYYRKPGQNRIRIYGVPGSDEFDENYRAAAAGELKPKPKKWAMPKDSIAWLCAWYYGTAEFRALDQATQRTRRGILNKFCAESCGTGPFETLYFDELTRRDLYDYRDRHTDHPHTANGALKALRQVYAAAEQRDIVADNPASKVKYLPSKNLDGHHTWTIAEVHQYAAHHPVGTMARLALDLYLYTGQRRSDAVKFGPQHITEIDDELWFRFTQFKGRKKRPVHLYLPIEPPLAASINATKCGDMTFLVNEFGRPFTVKGFGQRFAKWADAAGLPDRCRSHGLRKRALTQLSNNGFGDSDIMAVGGHRNRKNLDGYTREAEQVEQMLRARRAARGLRYGHEENEIVALSPQLAKSATISSYNPLK